MKLKKRKANKKGEYWTESELKKLVSEIQKNAFDGSKLQILFPDRSLQAIRNKVRKMRVSLDMFGHEYRSEKEEFTNSIAQKVKAKIVFEAYGGAGHQTIKWIKYADCVYVSEIAKTKFKQFEKNMTSVGFTLRKQTGNWYRFSNGKKNVFYFPGDAINAVAELKSKKTKIDLIDLDTCGSTILTIPVYLLMLNPKHLVITHGEYHSVRFKREDVLRRIFTHRDLKINPMPMDFKKIKDELDKAVKTVALRAHNDTNKSFWLTLKKEIWLGTKSHGMLRRYYKVGKPSATSTCLNSLSIN